MVRPTAELKARKELKRYLRTGRTLRVAVVFLTLAQRGPTMRFEQIWDTPLVRQYVRSKSVLHDTLGYMSKKGIVKIEEVSLKMVKITLLIELPRILSREVDRILVLAAQVEAEVNRITQKIESGGMSQEDASIFVRGMFIESELERLNATIMLLDVYRDPVLWPFLWGHMVLLLVVLPMIYQLQILRACFETQPTASLTAIESLGNSLSNVLKSEQFIEYQSMCARLKSQ